MNPMKLQRLFDAVRKEQAPRSNPGFESRVLHAIRNERRAQPSGLLEQLSGLFPRVGFASVLIILVCWGADLCFSRFGQADFATGVAQLSEDWLFTAKQF